MLTLTSLCGFGATAADTDVTPDPFTWPPLSDAGFVATVLTPPVTISGISIPVTLRASVSVPLTAQRTLAVLRDGIQVAQASSGFAADFTIGNGQTLQIALTNASDLTTWSGTLTLNNLSGASALLASCPFSLQDTGSGGGGGGGGGDGGGAAP
jgi:hypothetical protein